MDDQGSNEWTVRALACAVTVALCCVFLTILSCTLIGSPAGPPDKPDMLMMIPGPQGLGALGFVIIQLPVTVVGLVVALVGMQIRSEFPGWRDSIVLYDWFGSNSSSHVNSGYLAQVELERH